MAGYSSLPFAPRTLGRRRRHRAECDRSAGGARLPAPDRHARASPHPARYNAEDDCCFRAPLVKPYIFDAVRPVFALYGKAENLAWHENLDPGTHNYQLDNRLQAYRFFARHFGLPDIGGEPGVDAEVKSAEELAVGVPKSNLTILGLARKLAAAGPRTGTRERLAEVVRYRTVEARMWALDNSKMQGLESESARIDFSNGLSAGAVFMKQSRGTQPATITVLLNDKGFKVSGAAASSRINRGEEVLAADLLFTGESVPRPGTSAFAQLLAATGDRPLGLEAAQLIALAKFARQSSGASVLRLEATGIAARP